jgi:hypothetical protein
MAMKSSTYVCHTCRKIVPADTEAVMAKHFREHVREGILEEAPIPMSEGREGVAFQHIKNTHWGYITAIDGKHVAIWMFTYSPLALERWQIGGVVRVGDAVKVEFRPAQPGRGTRGTWFATPLGYKADWFENST